MVRASIDRRRFVAGAAAVAALPLVAVAQDKKFDPKVARIDVTYREIKRQPVAAPADKIEVIDFFWYGCPHCNAMQPALEKWRATLPPDVLFRRMPALLRDAWAPHARIFYTLEALGETERLHLEVYRSYHVEELFMSKPDVMLDWARRNGVDREKWAAAYNSDEVSRRIQDARRATKDYDIQGTPSIVVDGRWLTSSGLTDDINAVPLIADQLVKLARSRRR